MGETPETSQKAVILSTRREKFSSSIELPVSSAPARNSGAVTDDARKFQSLVRSDCEQGLIQTSSYSKNNPDKTFPACLLVLTR
jgi:hypothetical protein